MQVEKEIVKAIQHMEEVEVEVKRKKEISSKVKQLRKQVGFMQYTAGGSVVWHVCNLLAAQRQCSMTKCFAIYTHTGGAQSNRAAFKEAITHLSQANCSAAGACLD